MNPNVKRNEEPNYIKMTKNIASSMNGGGGIKNEEFKASLPISQPSKPGDKKMNDKKTTLDDIQKDDYFASKKPAPKYQSQNKPMVFFFITKIIFFFFLGKCNCSIKKPFKFKEHQYETKP